MTAAEFPPGIDADDIRKGDHIRIEWADPADGIATEYIARCDQDVWEVVSDVDRMLLVRREPTPTMPVLPSEPGAVNARAYDMGKHQRVIGVESDLISGRVIALGRIRSRDDVLVTAIDLTIWDELRTGGRVFGPNDLSGFVQTDGAVNLRLPHDPHRRSEVEDARAEVDHAFKLAAEEFMRATEEQR